MAYLTNRALALLTVGVVMVAGGLLALSYGVYLDVYDQWGWQVGCGNGFGLNLTQASTSVPNMVDQCQTAVAVRRMWAIPLTLAGIAVVAGWLVKYLRTAPKVVGADASGPPVAEAETWHEWMKR
jgi:hypothetical protein